MGNPNPDQSGLEQGKWKPGQSGNPKGKPKGAIHLSTHIQNALNDPDFEIKLKDGTVLNQMPMEAILKTAIAKSISGDTRAMDWLAKYGYGQKLIHDFERDLFTEAEFKIKVVNDRTDTEPKTTDGEGTPQ